MAAPISILIVDDDIKNLLVMETILDSPDYELIKASTADEALMALIHGECAAIVMDVKMPDISGIELAQIIKKRKKTQHIPIIFLTAHYYEDEHIVQGYDAGAVDYITKPVNPAVLRSKIGVFVDLFRKTTALASVNHAMEAEMQERQKAEEKFRLVVEAAPHAIIVIDHDVRISLVNSRTESLFGYERGELLRQPFEMLVPQGHGLESSREKSEEGRPMQGPAFELSGRRKDGSVVPIELQFSHFETADGVFELASVVDITLRKEAEASILATNAELAVKNAELQRNMDDRAQRIQAEAARSEAEAANRAKDRFLAMLSHELRTPLSPVLHTVALLEDDENCTSNMREMLQTIRRNVQLEARLIDDLLDLARIRNEKLNLHMEAAEAHDLLQRAVQICEPDTRTKKLRVGLDLQAVNTHLRADSARIQQIFWNLISNAIKYTAAGGAIDISTTNDQTTGHLRVTVKDTGMGIDQSRLKSIFDAFEQAHGDRSHGLGLGLAICRVLTTMHGGTIEAFSEGPGKGSTFTVSLPTTKKSAAPKPSHSPVSPAVLPSLRLLLVEDHADTAASLKKLLTRAGYYVESGASVKEALALMQGSSFDLLISDIGLPDGSGLVLMEPFFQAAGGRPVAGVALSGYGMAEDIQRSLDAGFDDHLIKPVDIVQLKKCLVKLGDLVLAKS